MEDCVFCRIVAGTLPARMVYSDEKTLAFLDSQPINPGHVLVAPRAHASQLADLDEETGGHVFKVAMKIAAGLRRSGVRCEGVNLLLSDGSAAFQEVFHVHLHVIPRFGGDGFRLKCGPRFGRRLKDKEFDEIAVLIRQSLL